MQKCSPFSIIFFLWKYQKAWWRQKKNNNSKEDKQISVG